jgi:hypothetical protein
MVPESPEKRKNDGQPANVIFLFSPLRGVFLYQTASGSSGSSAGLAARLTLNRSQVDDSLCRLDSCPHGRPRVAVKGFDSACVLSYG